MPPSARVMRVNILLYINSEICVSFGLVIIIELHSSLLQCVATLYKNISVNITFSLKCNCLFWRTFLTCGLTRGVSCSLPVFSIKKKLNSQGNLKKNLFKVLTIGFYTFCPSLRQVMDTIPKKLFLFQGKPFDKPFFDFFKIGKALLCE